jgi:hypothetical protein
LRPVCWVREALGECCCPPCRWTHNPGTRCPAKLTLTTNNVSGARSGGVGARSARPGAPPARQLASHPCGGGPPPPRSAAAPAPADPAEVLDVRDAGSGKTEYYVHYTDCEQLRAGCRAGATHCNRPPPQPCARAQPPASPRPTPAAARGRPDQHPTPCMHACTPARLPCCRRQATRRVGGGAPTGAVGGCHHLQPPWTPGGPALGSPGSRVRPGGCSAQHTGSGSGSRGVGARPSRRWLRQWRGQRAHGQRRASGAGAAARAGGKASGARP